MSSHVPGSGEHVCLNCKYFVRHYSKVENKRYHPLHLGHCIHPRVKNRRIDQTCALWTPKTEVPKAP